MTVITSRFQMILLALSLIVTGCGSKEKKEKLTLTPAGEKIRVEENWSALVGCKMISEIRVHTADYEDGQVLLKNQAAEKGAHAITDLEWGRGEKDGKKTLISKAEAYQCQ